MPTSGLPSGRVYIWYPEAGNVGHASMYLGNYEVGKSFEMSIDPLSPDFVRLSDSERKANLSFMMFNDNYVSWWPNGEAGMFNPKAKAVPKNGLYEDIKEEGSEPHVVYEIFGCDVTAMRRLWEESRDKTGANYQLYRKNCSDLVMRVLRAGGALSKLGTIRGGYFGRNLITTPKDVAVVCNKLRDAGWAVKTKAGNCPSKTGNRLMIGLGLR